VDSAGRYQNNIGYDLEEGTLKKLKFIKDYKFVISFENASYPGYTTEKILEPLLANCIPIYWGDPLINNDFNIDRFINYSSFSNEEEVIDHILELDKNNSLAVEVLKRKVFTTKQTSLEEHERNLKVFVLNIASKRSLVKPVAQVWFYSAVHKTKITAGEFIMRSDKVIRRILKTLLKPFFGKQLLPQ
jgi:hypothetical protein